MQSGAIMAARSSKTHPYAAIEHRVIDSPAYASLSFSARALLLQIARQLNGSNNGHLQATLAYLKQYGFSENTIQRGIADLIATGIIYRSRAGGYQQGPSKYAVTWLPLTKLTEGLFLAGFKACAWRDWVMPSDKTPPPKVRTCRRKFGVLTDATPPKSEAVPPPKCEDIELVPHRVAVSPSSEPTTTTTTPNSEPLGKRRATQETTSGDDGIHDNSTENVGDYTRIRDGDESTGAWDYSTGSFIDDPVRPPSVRQTAQEEINRALARRFH